MSELVEAESPAVPADESQPIVNEQEELPDPEPVDPLAQTFDAVIMGTGVIESIVAGYAVSIVTAFVVRAVHRGKACINVMSM